MAQRMKDSWMVFIAIGLSMIALSLYDIFVRFDVDFGSWRWTASAIGLVIGICVIVLGLLRRFRGDKDGHDK